MALAAAIAAPVAVLGLLSFLRLPTSDLRQELDIDRSRAAVEHARTAVRDQRDQMERLAATRRDLDNLPEYTEERLELAHWCVSNARAPVPDRCVADDGTWMTGREAQALVQDEVDAMFALAEHRDLALLQTDLVLQQAAHRGRRAALEAVMNADGPTPMVVAIAATAGGAMLFLAWLLFELGRWVPLPARFIVRDGEVRLAGTTAKLHEIERCVVQGQALVLVLHDHRRIGETRDLDLDGDTLHELAQAITETVHRLQTEGLPPGVQPRLARERGAYPELSIHRTLSS